MPTTTNKQRQVTQILTALKNRYSLPEAGNRPVLEQLIYSICREGTTAERAVRAFRNLQERFFDWNEVRVSSVREVQDALGSLPNAEARAHRLINFLQEVFETTFSFDLETLQKKGLKQAAKQLSRYQASSDYMVAWVVQNSLGGHALPLDAPMTRVLKRLGILDGDLQDAESMRGAVEHLVPKPRGPHFVELVSALADEICHEASPNCGNCPLVADCPTAQEEGRAVVATARTHRTKPR